MEKKEEKVLVVVKPKREVYEILKGLKTLDITFFPPIQFKGWAYIVDWDDERAAARYWYDSETINKLEYEDMSYNDGYEDWDGSWVDRPVKDEGYLITLGEVADAGFTLKQFEDLVEENHPSPLYFWKLKQLEKFNIPMKLEKFKDLSKAELFENGNTYAKLNVVK